MTESNGSTDAGDGGQADQSGQQQSGGGYSPPATQADLDRIIADRVARTKNQFKDYNDLKAKAAEFDKAEDGRKTAEQKATERADAAETRASAATQRAVRAEVKAIASGEFEYPDLAHQLIGDLSRFVTKDGDVDAEAIETALKEAEQKYPNLRKQGMRTDVGIGARGGSTGPHMNDLIRGGRGR